MIGYSRVIDLSGGSPHLNLAALHKVRLQFTTTPRKCFDKVVNRRLIPKTKEIKETCSHVKYASTHLSSQALIITTTDLLSKTLSVRIITTIM